MPALDLTPNVGTEASDFFQTDEALERQTKKLEKQTRLKNAGKPVKCASKVLQLLPVPAAALPSSTVAAAEEPFLMSAESGFIARIFSANTGKTMQTFRGHRGPVTCGALLPVRRLSDETFVVTGSWDKSIRKWNVKTGECVLTIPDAHADFVKCLLVRHYVDPNPFTKEPNVTLIFSGSSDAAIRVWNADTGACLAKLEGHRRAVESLALDYTGENLYSASSDTTIRHFHLPTQQCMAVLEGHDTSVFCLHLHEDEESLWSSSADNTVRRWDLKSGKPDVVLKHKDWVGTMAFIGPYLITGSRDEVVRVWDLQTEKVKFEFEGHFDEVSSVVVHGSQIYSGSYDCTVRTWSIEDSKKKSVKEAVEETVADNEEMKTTNAAAEGGVALTAEEEAELAELMDDD